MQKKLISLLILVLLGATVVASAQETITITTYYPSPYGVYRELRSQRMAVGTTYYNGATWTWDDGTGGCLADEICNADFVVEGNVGIGTTSPNRRLHLVGQSVAGAVPFTSGIQMQTAAGSNLGPALELWHDGEAGGRRFIILSTGSNNIGGVGLFQISDQTVNQARLSIDAAGNVGIGKTESGPGLNPVRLDVNGKIRGVSDYGDEIELGGDNIANDNQITIYSPAFRNEVHFWNGSLGQSARVAAASFTIEDIIFKNPKTQEILWRMFEDEDGLYLESVKTGKIYKFMLQEVDN